MHGAGGTTSLSPGVGHLKLRARLAYWDHLPSQLHRIHKHNSDTAKAAEGRQLAILTGFCGWPAPLGAYMTGRRVRYAGRRETPQPARTPCRRRSERGNMFTAPWTPVAVAFDLWRRMWVSRRAGGDARSVARLAMFRSGFSCEKVCQAV